jgi:type I restriction enzyme S subunit
MQFKDIPLCEVSRPKQWKTLSKKHLSSSGYPVFGANGIIGHTGTYTHEDPVLLIGCRGSCGTLHITGPHSYANGNAMAIDQLDETRLDLRYLYYFLGFRGLKDVITGSSQPQITRQSLSRVKIRVPINGSQQPDLDEQRRIAAILDRAELVRQQREEAVQLTEQLISSAFLDEFGDPVTNPMGWPTKTIGDCCLVTTGNTPPRSNPAYYGDHIEWIKSDNINTKHHLLTEAAEQLSEEGAAVGRTVYPGSILMTCIAGSRSSIGRVAIADRQVSFNQQINALTPRSGVSYRFLYVLLTLSQRLIQAVSTNGMKGLVSKGRLQKVLLPIPPLQMQKQFGETFDRLLRIGRHADDALEESFSLFNALVQRAFRGEL